jgi:hypothetical protein
MVERVIPSRIAFVSIVALMKEETGWPTRGVRVLSVMMAMDFVEDMVGNGFERRSQIKSCLGIDRNCRMAMGVDEMLLKTTYRPSGNSSLYTDEQLPLGAFSVAGARHHLSFFTRDERPRKPEPCNY